MKAIKFKKNAQNKLEYGDVDKPVENDNEVLVCVFSSSINAADYRSIKMGMTPKKNIYGSAISGKIESIGNNVKGFKPGDEVVADLSDFGFGGLAEFVAVPQEGLVIKPSKVSFEDAATLPVAATTALKSLRDKGNIQEGQEVLIVGSAGGVGSFAVQLAKSYGATISAVCSTRNIEQTKQLGADHVFDYTKEDFTKSEKRYDLVVAVNGNYSLFAYKRLLKDGGIYVMVGGSLKQIFKSILFGWALSFGSKKMKTLAAKSDAKDLEFVAKLMDEGKIRGVIEKRYPLEQTIEAMEFISDGHAQGKVIVNITQEA